MRAFVLLALAATVAGCGGQLTLPPVTGAFPYRQVAVLDDVNLREASGLAYHQQRGTLFAVGDRGVMVEMSTDGAKVHRERIRSAPDLEGIAYNPATALLYLAEEGKDNILEVDPETFKVLRTIPIDREFEGQRLLSSGGNGIEGITYAPDASRTDQGTFYLVNQSDQLEGKDPSVVFEVELAGSPKKPVARIIRAFSIGISNLSDIYYDQSRNELLIISGNNRILATATPDGKVTSLSVLPGANQEGITLDGDGFLYVAQDSRDGILKFAPAP